MDRINTDPTIRGLAQIVLICAIAGMALILLVFDIAIVARSAFQLSNAAILLIAGYLKIMSFPFKETFAPFLVIFAGVTPMFLTSVCFVLDVRSKVTDKLNPLGHASVIGLLMGLLVGAVALVILAAYKDPITASVGADRHPAIQGFVAALVGFQASLLVQLFGFKAK